MQSKRKHSYKRDAILDCIRCTDCHPTAEWVYQQLKPTIPDLSLATVYRNIGVFKQSGEIRSLGVVNGLERYDGDLRPHAHLLCRNCGAVADLEAVELPGALIEQLERDFGGSITGYQLQFTGLCAACNRNKNELNGGIEQ